MEGSWMKSQAPFLLLMLLGFFTLFFSVLGVVFNEDWIIPVLLLYVIWIILTFTLLLLKISKKGFRKNMVGEFEKTLKGGLYHFKCPSCNGIFAVKKSKRNNKKPVKMTCPDCGNIGFIPTNPRSIEGDIPEKKSIGVNFRCVTCGEGVTIWAEGTEINQNMNVYSCPYCGMEKTMSRV